MYVTKRLAKVIAEGLVSVHLKTADATHGMAIIKPKISAVMEKKSGAAVVT
jgi:hypothetical protein